MPSIQSTSSISDWQEDQSDNSTPRVSLAKCTSTLEGAKGTTIAQILMVYTPDGNADFTFIETVEGKDFDGKEGSFITMGRGFYDHSIHQTKASFDVVEGSGKGGLEGVKGKGTFASRKDDHKVTDYVFDLSW